jgi:hypothetical protein
MPTSHNWSLSCMSFESLLCVVHVPILFTESICTSFHMPVILFYVTQISWRAAFCMCASQRFPGNDAVTNTSGIECAIDNGNISHYYVLNPTSKY